MTATQSLRREIERALLDAPKPPLANSYWVIPGRLLAGEYPFGANPVEAHDRLARLRGVGVDAYLDLTEIGEMPGYRRLLPRTAEYRRFAIADAGVPAEAREMRVIQEHLVNALERRRQLYVHCRAGIGRTGLVVGCFLAQAGYDGLGALRTLNALWRRCSRAESWPQVPQTEAQARYVIGWPERRKDV